MAPKMVRPRPAPPVRRLREGYRHRSDQTHAEACRAGGLRRRLLRVVIVVLAETASNRQSFEVLARVYPIIPTTIIYVWNR
jgi:hypothetical protein